MAFFSNGDLLIRKGPDTRTFLDGVRAYTRQTNTHSIISDDPDIGLHRCNLQSGNCEPFGTQTIDFIATFGAYIDQATDDVYISDTSRHTLRKYSATGEQLAEPVGGFRFPNHLLIHDGKLIVADTNTFSIRSVSNASDSFGKRLGAFNVIAADAGTTDQRWPNHFARVGDEWWVNNMTSTMNKGGVFIFDDDGQFQRKLDLPDNADPISLLVIQDGVLISDWNNQRIHEFSVNGDARPDFTSSGLVEMYSESHALRTRYLMATWVTIALLLVTAAILVVKGTTPADSIIERDEKRATFNSDIPQYDEHIWIEPLPDMVKKIRWSLRTAAILVFR